MGRIILVVGNSGVGKTTLTAALSTARPLATGLEQHAERPFQALMAADPCAYALANQVDYLLLRAEQERMLRAGPLTGLIDGGLDLDFHGFTRLFHTRGYLDTAAFGLCARLYDALRDLLGPPDLIVHLIAPLEVLIDRYARRGRALEIARREDLADMERFVAAWLGQTAVPVIRVDAADDGYCSPRSVGLLLERIDELLAG